MIIIDDCFQTSGRAQPPAPTTSLMALTLFLLTGRRTNFASIYMKIMLLKIGRTNYEKAVKSLIFVLKVLLTTTKINFCFPP